jgi:hypothetical protein
VRHGRPRPIATVATLPSVGREALLMITLVCASVFSTRPSIASLALVTVLIVSLALLRDRRSHIASDDWRQPAA